MPGRGMRGERRAGQRAAPRPRTARSRAFEFRSGVACACLAAPERAARGCRSGDSRCDSFCRRTCIKTCTRHDLTGRTERRVKGRSEQHKAELNCLKRDRNFTFYGKSEEEREREREMEPIMRYNNLSLRRGRQYELGLFGDEGVRKAGGTSRRR